MSICISPLVVVYSARIPPGIFDLRTWVDRCGLDAEFYTTHREPFMEKPASSSSTGTFHTAPDASDGLHHELSVFFSMRKNRIGLGDSERGSVAVMWNGITVGSAQIKGLRNGRQLPTPEHKLFNEDEEHFPLQVELVFTDVDMLYMKHLDYYPSSEKTNGGNPGYQNRDRPLQMLGRLEGFDRVLRQNRLWSMGFTSNARDRGHIVEFGDFEFKLLGNGCS